MHSQTQSLWGQPATAPPVDLPFRPSGGTAATIASKPIPAYPANDPNSVLVGRWMCEAQRSCRAGNYLGWNAEMHIRVTSGGLNGKTFRGRARKVTYCTLEILVRATLEEFCSTEISLADESGTVEAIMNECTPVLGGNLVTFTFDR